MSKISKYMVGALATALVGSVFTSCEDDDIYSVDAPSWLQSEIDRIAAEKAKNQNSGSGELTGMMEDVYSFGKEDYTSGWWSAWSKYYVIPTDTTWNAIFNLHINPDDNTYYKNFALVVTTDAERGGEGYVEYGAFRYDATNDSAAYNSLWGSHLYFRFAESDAPMTPEDNKDAILQKMGGKVTLSVSRKPGSFGIKITNGAVTKTYNCPYELANLNSDPSNTNIRCFIAVEGSYIQFQQTNIEPVGGCTSANDKQPLSMSLNGVPSVLCIEDEMNIDELMAGVTATVNYEEDVTATVKAEDLVFTSVPDLNTVGKKTLVAVYAKTFKGEPAAKPLVVTADFEVVAFKTIEVDPIVMYFDPSRRSADSQLFIPVSKIVARGLDAAGNATLFNTELASQINFGKVACKVGETVVEGDWNGIKTSVKVTLAEATLDATIAGTGMVGTDDKATPWWSAFSEDFALPEGSKAKMTFTNYAGSSNWNNFVVILRDASNQPEYGVLRADNFGWGDGYSTAELSGGPEDWATWLAAMDGAKVTVEIVNGGGYADVYCEMIGNDGKTYVQYYNGVSVNSDNFEFAFTVDNSYFVFE